METAAGSNGSANSQTGTARVKRGMAEMLKGGVIMDVVTPEQARIAEGAGAVAVMALERVPADIRAQGGVSRMSDPDMIEGIISAVKKLGLKLPVVLRAEGTNVEQGKKMLAESGLSLVMVDDMGEGAQKVVALARGATA